MSSGNISVGSSTVLIEKVGNTEPCKAREVALQVLTSLPEQEIFGWWNYCASYGQILKRRLKHTQRIGLEMGATPGLAETLMAMGDQQFLQGSCRSEHYAVTIVLDSREAPLGVMFVSRDRENRLTKPTPGAAVLDPQALEE